MKRNLTLSYTVPLGELAPFETALSQGKALASVCAACGFTAFPPRPHCLRCGVTSVNLRELSGQAEIIHRTSGRQGDFALVQFQGADTRATVRLYDIVPTVATGRLIAPLDEHNGLWLGADVTEAGEETNA